MQAAILEAALKMRLKATNFGDAPQKEGVALLKAHIPKPVWSSHRGYVQIAPESEQLMMLHSMTQTTN